MLSLKFNRQVQVLQGVTHRNFDCRAARSVSLRLNLEISFLRFRAEKAFFSRPVVPAVVFLLSQILNQNDFIYKLFNQN